MCDFLALITAPAAFDLAREAARPRLAVEPAVNASLQRHVPSGLGAYWLTSGGCSCGLYRGPQPEDEDLRQTVKARLEKRGLRGRKLELAIREAMKAAESRGTDHSGFHPDVVRVVASLLEAAHAVRLCLLEVSGPVTEEDFGRLARARVVLGSGPLYIPDNAIVEVVPATPDS